MISQLGQIKKNGISTEEDPAMPWRRERIFKELMTLVRKLKASGEGSESRNYGRAPAHQALFSTQGFRLERLQRMHAHQIMFVGTGVRGRGFEVEVDKGFRV